MEVVVVEDDDFFLGFIILRDDLIKYTLKNELKLFGLLCVQLLKTQNLLVLLGQHASQISNMFYLGH
jgi:hypothetical protein